MHVDVNGTRLWFDGMNLIGSRPDRWWNDPDRAVRRLIGELDRYAADHEIVRMLAEARSPDAFRVVKSDRGLAERARRLGAAVTSSGSFRRRMDQALEDS